MLAALLLAAVVIGVLVNVALIRAIARADDLALRVPESLKPAVDVWRREAPRPETRGLRRRALYVAAAQARPGATGLPPTPSTTLPPDLAEFLWRPAEIVSAPGLRCYGALVANRHDIAEASAVPPAETDRAAQVLNGA